MRREYANCNIGFWGWLLMRSRDLTHAYVRSKSRLRSRDITPPDCMSRLKLKATENLSGICCRVGAARVLWRFNKKYQQLGNRVRPGFANVHCSTQE